MIGLKNISYTFHPGTVMEQKALEQIDLSIGPAEFVVIVGSNGSGKSTLLKLISGHLALQSGSISFNGQNIIDSNPADRAQKVAMVFQDPLAGTVSDLTVAENLRLAALRGRSKTVNTGLNAKFRSRAKDVLHLLNMELENKLDLLVSNLSGGQRQALTIAMSTMSDSSILLLDEPTAALDPRSADAVMLAAVKAGIEQNMPVVLVTHNMQQALRYGNRLLMMDKGRIIKDCSESEKSQMNVMTLLSWFGDRL